MGKKNKINNMKLTFSIFTSNYLHHNFYEKKHFMGDNGVI